MSGSLIGIYKYVNGIEVNGDITGSSAYCLLTMFNDNGIVDGQFQNRIYKAMFDRRADESLVNCFGPFDNLSSLNRYSYKICEELNADEVVLLSIQDYNLLMENISNACELKEALLKQGNRLENIEIGKNKLGFIKKLFV